MAINVSQAFHRTSANPVDESMTLTKAQMLTVNDNLMPAYYFTICQDDGEIYLYDKTATASVETGKFKKFAGGGSGGGGADLPSGGTTGQVLAKHSNADGDVEWKDDEGGQTIQYSTMPTASATNLGQIAQYIGTTDTDYTNGLFYECVSDGEATPTYSWAEKLVQNTDVDLANVFASGMPISTADKRPFAYSTEEQIVGSWINGKPLYQKTFVDNTAFTGNSKTVDISSLNAEYVQCIYCCFVDVYQGTYTYSPLCFYDGTNYGNIQAISSTAIGFKYTTDFRNNRGTGGYIMTLQYTKTTD